MAEGKKNATRLKAWLLFVDESGLLMAPLVRRSWNPRGQTPILYQRTRTRHKVSIIAALCVSPARDRVHLYFRLYVNRSIDSADIGGFLSDLRKHLHGPKLLIWDRLGAHRSKQTQTHLQRLGDYRVILLPPYAPELNPVESVWGYLKMNPLANLAATEVDDLARNAKRHARSLQGHRQLLRSFIAHSPLTLRLR